MNVVQKKGDTKGRPVQEKENKNKKSAQEKELKNARPCQNEEDQNERKEKENGSNVQVAFTRKESGSFRPGVKNIGNSCYMGAVLQCLASVEYSGDPRGEESKCEVAREYWMVIKKLQQASSGLVTPSRLKRVIGRIDQRFNDFKPQDAHEFIMFLLEQLGSEGPREEMSVVKFGGTIMSLMRCFSCQLCLVCHRRSAVCH